MNYYDIHLTGSNRYLGTVRAKTTVEAERIGARRFNMHVTFLYAKLRGGL